MAGVATTLPNGAQLRIGKAKNNTPEISLNGMPVPGSQGSAGLHVRNGAYAVAFIATITTIASVISMFAPDFFQSIGIDAWALVDAALMAGLFCIVRYTKHYWVLHLAGLLFLAGAIFMTITMIEIAVESVSRPGTGGFIVKALLLWMIFRGGFASGKAKREEDNARRALQGLVPSAAAPIPSYQPYQARQQ